MKLKNYKTITHIVFILLSLFLIFIIGIDSSLDYIKGFIIGGIYIGIILIIDQLQDIEELKNKIEIIVRKK